MTTKHEDFWAWNRELRTVMADAGHNYGPRLTIELQNRKREEFLKGTSPEDFYVYLRAEGLLQAPKTGIAGALECLGHYIKR